MLRTKKQKEIFYAFLVIGLGVSLILLEHFFSRVIFDFLIGEKSIATSVYGNQAFYIFGILILCFAVPFWFKHWSPKVFIVLALIFVFVGLTHSFGITNSGIYFLNYKKPLTPERLEYKNIEKVFVDASIFTSYASKGGAPHCHTDFQLIILSKVATSKVFFLDGFYPTVSAIGYKLKENKIPIVLSKKTSCILQDEQDDDIRQINEIF